MTDELKEDLVAVIAELEKKCKEHPDNVMAFQHLGLVYMKAGRMEEAVTALKRTIEIDDLCTEAMINLGAIYFGMGEIDKAQKLNEQAVGIQPENAQAHANLGLIWQQRNELEKALEAYNKAVQFNPKLASTWINLTSILTMKGEDERAVEAARKALNLEPDSPLGHNNLAVALYFVEKYEDSKNHMLKAKDLGYSVDPNFVEKLEEKIS
ncbi:tetratricopeptide repeat protein [Desulforhopalus vacuolatus]|uniref:tetratricopeptide repeat protein n=1 Tax=Desulforhopalus vacuolatus TaxID=40414 RepID=UPI001962C87E|nr:tetratricopeptide repeat protein [Desulforhopalus vacuolatus]MBM9518874.1 tetratricopeptide repeat protein [Desulforhopalus vacuolatus]